MSSSISNLLALFLVLSFCAETAVGGTQVKVQTHVKLGVDPELLQPQPAVLRTVAYTQLMRLSWLHMEPDIGKMKGATGSDEFSLEICAQLHPSKGPTAQGQSAAKEAYPHWWHGSAAAGKGFIFAAVVPGEAPARWRVDERALTHLSSDLSDGVRFVHPYQVGKH